MSSIGFAPGPDSEVELLRSAYKSMNDVTRNLSDAVRSIKQNELRMAEHYLRAAEWHASQAKRTIAIIGQSKAKRA